MDTTTSGGESVRSRALRMIDEGRLFMTKEMIDEMDENTLSAFLDDMEQMQQQVQQQVQDEKRKWEEMQQQVQQQVQNEKRKWEEMQQQVQNEKRKREEIEIDRDNEIKLRKQIETNREKISLYRLIRNYPEFMQLKCKGTKSSYIGSSQHAKAKSQFLFTQLGQLDDDDDLLKSNLSSLLLHFDGKEQSYYTEADISSYVRCAIGDAIKLVFKKTNRQLYAHRDYSLWSDRPDHFVLRERITNDIILVIEDKKPWKAHESGDVPTRVQGQMFDYLMNLKCLGHSCPFAVLTTFNSSWMFCQNNETSIDLAGSTHNSIPYASPSPSQSTATYSTSTSTLSPLKVNHHVRRDAINGTESTYSHLDPNTEDAILLCSQEFQSKDLVPLLYKAILCGLENHPASRKTKMKIPRSTYSGAALKLTKEAYQWVNLELNVDKPIKPIKSEERRRIGGFFGNTEYFAIKQISRGNTWKVFEAYDQDGRLCVIKMYVKRNEGVETMDDKEFTAKGKEVCDKEAFLLKSLYPSFKEKVFSIKLNKIYHCVVMPFFRSLTKDELSEKSLEAEVRKCLRKFREIKVRYTESDLCWRYVGYYDYENEGKDEKELVMFDLAEIDDSDYDQSVISSDESSSDEKQFKALWKRLSREESTASLNISQGASSAISAGFTNEVKVTPKKLAHLGAN